METYLTGSNTWSPAIIIQHQGGAVLKPYKTFSKLAIIWLDSVLCQENVLYGLKTAPPWC